MVPKLLSRFRSLGWPSQLGWLAGGGLVGALLLWSGLNLVHADPPPSLWAPDDLPPLPAPEENGWREIAEHAEVFRPAAAPVIDEAVRPFVQAAAARAAPTAAELRAAGAAFQRPEVRAAWGVCRAALAKKAFADACPLDAAAPCPSLEIVHCHRLVSFAILAAVARGDFGAAVAELERLLEQGFGHAASARSPLSLLVALRNVREGLRLARHLHAWLEPAAPATQLAPLRRRVVAFEPAGVDFGTAFVGEYLVLSRGVVLLAQGQGETGELGLPGFFFDAGATLGELNRLYEGARAPAAGPRRPAARGRLYAEGFGWWVSNPLGKLYLDAALPPPAVYDSLERERARLIEEHRELVAAWPGR